MSAWYRTYRPAKVEQLHLTSVREQLERLLQNGKLPQVWLFAGPKGTGKTSTARILAALVNSPNNAEQVVSQFSAVKAKATANLKPLTEPDYADPLVSRIKAGQAFNVQELDAASHRGIDDVRALKERVAVPPTEGAVSVVILDEVHMLTTEAFNALLKLLEEPPAHVMFILATTELHKLPATVVSRCTLIQFSKATIDELVTALQGITKAEGVKTETGALSLIAEQADGSFRDAVKLAEQLSSELGGLTLEAVSQRLVGTLGQEIDQLVAAVVHKEEAKVVEICQTWRSRGLPAGLVEKMVVLRLHAQLMQALGVEQGQAPYTERVLVFLLQEFSQVELAANSPIVLLALELKCLELVFRAKDKQRGSEGPTTSGGKTVAKAVAKPEPAAKSVVDRVVTEVSSESSLVTSPSPKLEAPDVSPETEVVPPTLISDDLIQPDPEVSAKLLNKWQEFITGVKQRNSSLAAILGSARPQLGQQGQAQICVFYRFHQEQLQQPKFKKMVDESIHELIGTLVPVEFILETPPISVPDGADPQAALNTLVADVLT